MTKKQTTQSDQEAVPVGPTDASESGDSSFYEIHPLALMFPPMNEEEFSALKNDIHLNGQLEPVSLFEGRIIDGVHRARASRELGLPLNFVELDSSISPLAYVISRNLRRRDLTPSQRAVVAAKLLPLLAEEAKKRQQIHRNTARGRTATTPPEIVPGVKAGEAREEAARLTGSNSKYVTVAKQLLAQSPELVARIESGALTIPAARRALRALPGDKPVRPLGDASADEGAADGNAAGRRGKHGRSGVRKPSGRQSPKEWRSSLHSRASAVKNSLEELCDGLLSAAEGALAEESEYENVGPKKPLVGWLTFDDQDDLSGRFDKVVEAVTKVQKAIKMHGGRGRPRALREEVKKQDRKSQNPSSARPAVRRGGNDSESPGARAEGGHHEPCSEKEQ